MGHVRIILNRIDFYVKWPLHIHIRTSCSHVDNTWMWQRAVYTEYCCSWTILSIKDDHIRQEYSENLAAHIRHSHKSVMTYRLNWAEMHCKLKLYSTFSIFSRSLSTVPLCHAAIQKHRSKYAFIRFDAVSPMISVQVSINHILCAREYFNCKIPFALHFHALSLVTIIRSMIRINWSEHMRVKVWRYIAAPKPIRNR